MILFLGGCGFMGRSLIPYLDHNNYSIRVFDRNKNIYPKQIQYITGNFYHCTDTSIFEGIDTVIHAISSSLPNSKIKNIKEEVSHDLLSFIDLLNHCVQHGIRKIILFSSAGTVYGERKEKAKETDICNPISVYGIHKHTMEQYMMLYARFYNISCISLRISNPYGIEQFQGAKNGIIATFLKNIKSNQPCTIWGEDTICKDYIYIEDLQKAILKVLSLDIATGIYNVGYGKSYTIAQIVTTIEKILNRKLEIKVTAGQKHDVKNIFIDISKIQKMTHWSPQVDIEQGIMRMSAHLNLENIT